MDVVELIDMFEDLFSQYVTFVVFIFGFIEMSPFGWWVPAGVLTAIAGFFAFGNSQMLVAFLVASWLGTLLFVWLTYALGQYTGSWFVKKFKQEKNAKRARNILKSRGGAVLSTSMLAGILRFRTAYVAGTQKHSPSKFFFYAGVGSLTWTSLFTMTGHLAGSKREFGTRASKARNTCMGNPPFRSCGYNLVYQKREGGVC